MAKYIKINDCKDIIEVNDEIIEGKHYCWNCEYFCPPQGCAGIFGNTNPFSFCDEWSRATDEELESIKKVINECCEINPLKKIKIYRRMLKEYKKDINELIDNIIVLIDLQNSLGVK